MTVYSTKCGLPTINGSIIPRPCSWVKIFKYLNALNTISEFVDAVILRMTQCVRVIAYDVYCTVNIAPSPIKFTISESNISHGNVIKFFDHTSKITFPIAWIYNIEDSTMICIAIDFIELYGLTHLTVQLSLNDNNHLVS